MKLKYNKLEGSLLAIIVSLFLSIRQGSGDSHSVQRLVKILAGSIMVALISGVIIYPIGNYFTPFINLVLEFIYGLAEYIL